MAILCTPEYGEGIQSLVRSATTEIVIASAYSTRSGAEKMFGLLSASLRRKEIHVRWQADDLLSGASDLEVYELAKDFGVAMFMQPDLHAKFVMADRRRVVVGSANVTGRGLGISPVRNSEAGIICEPPKSEIRRLEQLLERSVLVTPDLFDRMRTFVEKNRLPPRPATCFPQGITSVLDDHFTGLWVRDLPLAPLPPSLHGEAAEDSDDELERNFANSKCLRWLRSLLQAPDYVIYFGELTSSLHDTLLEDPTPYRTELKKLVSNLLNWCATLRPEEFGVDSPNYSQRIFLKSQV